MTNNAQVAPATLTNKIQILETALKLFADKGFEGASTREIALQAQVNHALIKYHFGSKESLWRAAVDHMFTALDEAMEESRCAAEAMDNPADQLRTVLRHYIIYCAKHPEHGRIMVQESTSANPRLAWAVDRHIATTKDWNWFNFEDLMEQGYIPRMSEISLRYIIVAACQSIFTLAAEAELLFDTDVTQDEHIEAHIEAVIKLLLRS